MTSEKERAIDLAPDGAAHSIAPQAMILVGDNDTPFVKARLEAGHERQMNSHMILYKARVEEQSLTLAFFICKKQIHLLIGRVDGHEQNCVKQKYHIERLKR